MGILNSKRRRPQTDPRKVDPQGSGSRFLDSSTEPRLLIEGLRYLEFDLVAIPLFPSVRRAAFIGRP